MELAAEYAPQNFYCFTLDVKSDSVFKNRMRNLANCFPNVFISEREYNTTSWGTHINYALMDCFGILIDFQWEYVISLNVGRHKFYNN